MSMVDLSEPIRDAILSSSDITSLLDSYKSSYPVFTRRPVPDDAPPIVIVISQDVTSDYQDGINDFRPVIVRDVVVFGPNEPASQFRRVQQIARHIHSLFHHSRHVLNVQDWTTVLIIATGPVSLPQDDQTVAEAVTIQVTLAAKDE